MTQHEEAFPYGEAVRLAEKYGLLCRTFNAIDGVEACCPNCGHILTDSLAALEAAEAKFEESRADNHRMALELADLLCERKELRETINSVAVCQKHITEITAGACMICEIEQLREQAAQARRTSQYWKDCHIAGNAEIDKLRAQVSRLEREVAELVEALTAIIEAKSLLEFHAANQDGKILLART